MHRVPFNVHLSPPSIKNNSKSQNCSAKPPVHSMGGWNKIMDSELQTKITSPCSTYLIPFKTHQTKLFDHSFKLVTHYCSNKDNQQPKNKSKISWWVWTAMNYTHDLINSIRKQELTLYTVRHLPLEKEIVYLCSLMSSWAFHSHAFSECLIPVKCNTW